MWSAALTTVIQKWSKKKINGRYSLPTTFCSTNLSYEWLYKGATINDFLIIDWSNLFHPWGGRKKEGENKLTLYSRQQIIYGMIERKQSEDTASRIIVAWFWCSFGSGTGPHYVCVWRKPGGKLEQFGSRLQPQICGMIESKQCEDELDLIISFD